MKAADLAYRQIRQAILSDDLTPGQRLPESLLVEITGVSRTPVREALARLLSDGFVETTPNQGARVATWSLKTIEEVFAVRVLLESHAAERAASRLTEGQILAMTEAQDRLEQAVLEEDPEYEVIFSEMNLIFHSTIFEAAHEPRITNALKQLSQLPVVFRTLNLYDDEALRRSMGHHREILSALKARDRHWARAAMETHIRSAQHLIAQELENRAPQSEKAKGDQATTLKRHESA